MQLTLARQHNMQTVESTVEANIKRHTKKSDKVLPRERHICSHFNNNRCHGKAEALEWWDLLPSFAPDEYYISARSGNY